MKNENTPGKRATIRSGSVSVITGMGARIDTIAKKLGGKRALARATGIHETQIYRYIRETCLPGAIHLALIARAGDVHADWLLTGHDGIRDDPARYDEAGLNRQHLWTILCAVEEALEETRRSLAPDKKAELISLLYSMYADSGSTPEKSNVIKLLKSVT
jgi:transcriptional regulator with XRE-family HTH domain